MFLGKLAIVSVLAMTAGFAQNLDQGWTKQTAHQFWFLDQGSRLVPYAWFMKLECPKSPATACADSTRFVNGLERFGFVPSPPLPDLNPDNLPVGMTRSDDPVAGAYVGLTCAACHSTQIDFPGVGKVFVEGAPNMLDNDMFFQDVTAAVNDTIADPERFARFSQAMDGSPDLLAQMKVVAARLNQRKRINTAAVKAGFGRADAFSQIFNQLLIAGVGNSEQTAMRPDAPASYPFLWDIAQHRAVQWNGSATNLGQQGTGSMLRNVGEVLGVFGDIKVEPASGLALPRYPSSVRTDNLKTIEVWLTDLHSPVWPGPLDRTRVASGKQVYAKARCNTCHAAIDRMARKYPLPVTMTPVAEVGTDSRHIDNFRLRSGYPMGLKGRKTLVDARNPLQRFGDVAPAKDLAVHITMGAYLAKQTEASRPEIAKNFVRDSVRSLREGPPPAASYKARPLDGIWATAPYLHNGSVPNLAELLKKPEQRITTFCVGSNRLDITNVGYETGCEGRSFQVDTSIPGNRNAGHVYGTDLSEAEKRDLIEYLKSL